MIKKWSQIYVFRNNFFNICEFILLKIPLCSFWVNSDLQCDHGSLITSNLNCFFARCVEYNFIACVIYRGMFNNVWTGSSAIFWPILNYYVRVYTIFYRLNMLKLCYNLFVFAYNVKLCVHYKINSEKLKKKTVRRYIIEGNRVYTYSINYCSSV